MTPENAIDTLRKQALSSGRVAALRQRRAAQGLVRLELYVHPDDQAAVKTLAKSLAQSRLADRQCADQVCADQVCADQVCADRQHQDRQCADGGYTND